MVVMLFVVFFSNPGRFCATVACSLVNRHPHLADTIGTGWVNETAYMLLCIMHALSLLLLPIVMGRPLYFAAAVSIFFFLLVTLSNRASHNIFILLILLLSSVFFCGGVQEWNSRTFADSTTYIWQGGHHDWQWPTI